jgi:hypothetical protein
MSTFGNTTESEGAIDRGPPEEDRRTPAELRGDMEKIARAKMTIGEQATVKGLREEMKILRSLVDDVCEQNNKLISLYQTLRGEFDQYKQQRAIELQSWLAGGGSTTREDVEGGTND